MNNLTAFKLAKSVRAGQPASVASVVALVGLGLCASGLPAFADGVQLKRGHVVHPHTTLSIDAAQQQAIKKGHLLTLSPEQKGVLVKAVGWSPQTLSVMSLKETRNTCTCSLRNIAVATSPKNVEVVHFLLGETESARDAHKYGSP